MTQLLLSPQFVEIRTLLNVRLEGVCESSRDTNFGLLGRKKSALTPDFTICFKFYRFMSGVTILKENHLNILL